MTLGEGSHRGKLVASLVSECSRVSKELAFGPFFSLCGTHQAPVGATSLPFVGRAFSGVGIGNLASGQASAGAPLAASLVSRPRTVSEVAGVFPHVVAHARNSSGGFAPLPRAGASGSCDLKLGEAMGPGKDRNGCKRNL